MKNFDWKRKLTSRKFWMALAAFVEDMNITLKGSAEVAETVSGCIMAGASVIAYAIGEGLADAGNKPADTKVDENKPTDENKNN